jgi:hypothetical protein
VRAADADVTYYVIAPEGDEGEVGDTGPLRAQVLDDGGLLDSRGERPLVHFADRVVVVGLLRTDGEYHSTPMLFVKAGASLRRPSSTLRIRIN